jgi:class 3 adenylate cyclase/pimeloyl-ACP methyl ester carboxylesterase
MEPQIQYARTEDGVSIAYTTVGDGPPVLYCPTQYLSMRWFLDDAHPELWLARGLAGRTRITLFDHAGMGASQRQVGDFSFAAQLRAIEAVAARLAGDPLTLVGMGAGAAGAALYAAKHQGGVRELVCLYPASSIITERFAATMREDWSLARRRLAGWAYPDSITNQRWFSTGMRESTTADVAAAYAEEFARADLPEIYRRIPVPTLIIVGPEGQDREGALALASLVPDCRVATETSVGIGIAAAALEFMGVDVAQLNPSDARAFDAHGTAVILFADIVDSTALTERMGDAAFRTKARALEVSLRSIISEAGGTTIDAKTLGDGVLATFPSASQAIDAALRCGAAGADGGLPLHLGLHAGDVIRESNNVFGGAVNIASRISALSAPGEVLISRTVADLARTSARVRFEDRGEQEMKGVGEPVRVYAVRGLP